MTPESIKSILKIIDDLREAIAAVGQPSQSLVGIRWAVSYDLEASHLVSVRQAHGRALCGAKSPHWTPDDADNPRYRCRRCLHELKLHP